MHVKEFISATLENVKSRWRSNGRESSQKFVVIVVVVPQGRNIRKKKHEKLGGYQVLGEVGEYVWRESSSGPRVHRSTWDSDPETGGVTPAESRNSIRDLCPEEQLNCSGPVAGGQKYALMFDLSLIKGQRNFDSKQHTIAQHVLQMLSALLGLINFNYTQQRAITTNKVRLKSKDT